jgi:hypothetical protein
MRDVSDPPATEKKRAPGRIVSPRSRVALAVGGAASWAAGGVASFMGSNGAGAAALVLAGAICGILSLMGRWPSRISMSGNVLAVGFTSTGVVYGVADPAVTGSAGAGRVGVT